MDKLDTRFWVESGLALVSAGLLVLTLIGRNWIEEFFKVDPDAGSGAAEWIVVGVALAVTVASVSLASREWKRHKSRVRSL